jgi:hypothetical protein
VPVLLVTGYSHAVAAAEVDFPVLRKPFQLADLGRAAAKLIGEARQPPPANLVRLGDAKRGIRGKTERS